MAKIKHPYYPIIYVRGYAMTQNEIDDTSSTPYMGFNLGATKVRQNWKGEITRYIFESPLVRLMKDHDYEDIYLDGQEKKEDLSARSVVIYRYYEEADSDLGSGEVLKIPEAATGLGRLILDLRDKICGDDPEEKKHFKVYLVAHSMGGLICRALLQNAAAEVAESPKLIDKVFTYATPHNGIEMGGLNVPKFLSLWDMNNFNRKNIAKYLGLTGTPDRVDSLNGKFDPRRFFCLVGTNPGDYDTAKGLSSKLAGKMSDGLVRSTNATVRGAPRAYVHRSHSGPIGIVNSEEGYQNLVRFLFGTHQVDGLIEVENLPLPPPVREARKKGKEIRGSYYFETTLAPRGALTYTLTQRRKETYSAVLRSFDELLRVENISGLEAQRSPYMFTAFLDTSRIAKGRTMVFSADLTVSATDYEIDGFAFFNRTIPGEYLYRNQLVIRVTLDGDQFRPRYLLGDDDWGETNGGRDLKKDDDGYFIPLSSKKGFRGKLRFLFAPWNNPD